MWARQGPPTGSCQDNSLRCAAWHCMSGGASHTSCGGQRRSSKYSPAIVRDVWAEVITCSSRDCTFPLLHGCRTTAVDAELRHGAPAREWRAPSTVWRASLSIGCFVRFLLADWWRGHAAGSTC